MIGKSTKKQPEALKTADHNMKLYYSPAACSLAPHIVAREAGLNIELEKVDLRSKKTESGRDYLGINPKGAVPALEIDDGKVLTENAVVLQYLADKSPQMSLPKGMERWRLLELLHFIATELHKGFAPLFDPRTDKERREIVTENLSKRFDILERQLGDKPHLTGEQVHDRRCLCLHGSELVQVSQHRYEPLAQTGGIYRARWCSPGCARGSLEGRSAVNALSDLNAF